MLLHSALMAPGQKLDVDVACVEAGRWRGREEPPRRRRRAPSAVRGATHGLRPENRWPERPAEHRKPTSPMWRRVRYYERTYGQSDTSSLVELGRTHGERGTRCPQGSLRRAIPELAGPTGASSLEWRASRLLELFDELRALADQWDSICRRPNSTPEPSGWRVPAWRARYLRRPHRGALPGLLFAQGIAEEVVAEDLSLFSARRQAHGEDLLHLSAVNADMS